MSTRSDDYNHVAEQFKESLIRDYLKKHPGITRAQIVARTINGRIVIDTIDNVFKHAAGQKKVQESIDKQKIKELIDKGEKRLESSIESLKNSKSYVQWLYRSRFTNFTEKDREEVNSFLEQKEIALGKCAIEADQSKQKLVEMLHQKVRATSSLVRTVLQETLQAVGELLKNQASIYKREVDLGDHVSRSMQEFIKSCATVAKALVKPTTINAMARAYQILRNESIDTNKITNPENLKKLKSAVDELDEQLNQRREIIKAIQQLVDYVEEVVASAGKLEEMEKKEKPKEDSRQRMAFTSKKRR